MQNCYFIVDMFMTTCTSTHSNCLALVLEQ